jgi:hypothetical protein
MKSFITGLIVALIIVAATCFAGEREKRSHKREHHNWIIERQTAGQVQGVPTSRRIIGKREIDVYRNGLMFERNNVVGVERSR